MAPPIAADKNLMTNGSVHDQARGQDKMPGITSSTKDVFKGQVLIDRLLIYYSKFEGSRERAARYAQKLLDLGHIESATNSLSFEDSAQIYRWTDVAQVVNKAKARAQSPNKVVPLTRQSLKERSMQRPSNGEGGKSILRISIETDNCDGAEIKAKIRASPRGKLDFGSKSNGSEPTIISSVEEDSFFGRRVTKTLSYSNEPSTENFRRLPSPQVTEITSFAKTFGHSSKINGQGKTEKDTNGHASDIEERKNIPEQINDVKKEIPKERIISTPSKSSPLNPGSNPKDVKSNQGLARKASSVDVLKQKSATVPLIVTKQSPGQGASNYGLAKGFQNAFHKGTNQQTTAAADGDCGKDAITATSTKVVQFVSTQTSERSILHASRLYNGTNAKSLSDPGKKVEESCASSRSGSATEIFIELKPDKTRAITKDFQQDSDKEIGKNDTKELINDVYRKKNESYLNVSDYADLPEEENDYLLKVKESLTLPLSPPPPSPSFTGSPMQSPTRRSSMKSLFWTKIEKGLSRQKQRIIWDEVEDDFMFDEDEFEKMFSKPPPSPKGPRIKSERSQDNGKVLKVLPIERSRQVGIRANTVRLKIDEIHDAIVNMDDTKLDLDALQALYDVRPSAEELDEIADALKAQPTCILDKPEQFVLMLAMIPSLDERLKCWIFAKKFPDKMVEIQEQLIAVGEACNDISKSETLRKVLEIVLTLGNHMNKGTTRGDAYGYYLDILPKLKDVKTQNGESTLFDYVVTIMREQKKLEGTLDDLVTPRAEETFGRPDQDVLARAVTVILPDVGDELEATAVELEDCRKNLLPTIVRASTIPAESEQFQTKLEEFLETATEKLRIQAQLYQDTVLTAEDFRGYFVPNWELESKISLSSMLEAISCFCSDYRKKWVDQQRQALRREFYKIEKYKQQRQSMLQVKSTPSALKERFMARRKKKTEENQDKPPVSPNTKQLENGTMTPTNGYGRNVHIPKRNYKFSESLGRDSVASPDGNRKTPQSSRSGSAISMAERASSNAKKLEKRLQELQTRAKNGNTSQT
ncbi:unnamed protein product [Clavelina lepadiformis]|uniref:FH2 domain-containing protein n=1 Tax=Clavelina lepadiformis TaxID=159417 RepID=A0ABP0GXU9_CLALP